MNKKIVLIVSSTLILVTSFIYLPLSFAQIPFDYCRVEAYVSEYVSAADVFTFKAADPPSGLDISNTINLVNYGNDENYTINIQPGEDVIVFSGEAPSVSVEPASVSDHYIISFEGPTTWVTINMETIPEFPPFLIVPLFITATILALIYRRKHKT